MFLVNAVQGTADSTVPFTPGSVATHVSYDRLTLYVVGRDPVSSTPDTPTATNGWVLVKRFLDPTTDLFLYAFAIQATSSSMAAPQIAFPGSTPTVTAWVMSSHRVTGGRFWKDPIGYAGNDTTTFGDYIFPHIASGTQYSHDNYPLPTTWFGGGMSAGFGVLAVPTDSSAALDQFNTLIIFYNMQPGTYHRAPTQYVDSSAGGGLGVAWVSNYGFSGNPLENINAAMKLDPATSEDGLIISAILREDNAAPPNPPILAASGSGSLILSVAPVVVGVGSATAAGTASLSLSGTGTAAAPPSDNSGTSWNNAQTLVLGNGNTFTRSNAVVGTARPYYRAWWQFTASVSGSVTLDTYGSTAGDITSADTLIYVYNVASEPVDVNAWYGRNDDTDEGVPPAPGEYLSKLTFEAAEGVTYHVLIGTYSATGDTVAQYRINAVGTPLGGVQPVSVWTTPIRLTTDSDPFGDPGSDEGSLASGDLCHLGNNQIVVMDFSSWSYAVRLWAIDISGPTPAVGPMKVVNGTDDDFSWMTTPHPGDPRGAAMYPCTFVIPLTSTTFAIVGPGNETYDASGNLDGSGDYVHAASFFAVNPTTKVITRTAFVVVDYTTLGPPPWGSWVDDVTAAALGTNAVVLMDVNENYVLIARNDGSTTVYLNIDGLSNPNFNSPVVFDEDVVWLAFHYPTSPDDQILYRMQHAIGSSSAVQGDVLVGSEDWITDQFVTKTSTGLAAFLTSANHVSQRSNIMLSLIDHDTLTANTPTLVMADTWTFGWTSDWGGNVKSITAMEDGKMLVSYVEFYDRLMHFVEVSATKTPGTPELIPFPNPNGYFVQMARSCYGVGKMAAIQVRQTNASYEGGTYIFGVYFIVRDFAPPVVEPEGPADPYPEAARVHFWGQ